MWEYVDPSTVAAISVFRRDPQKFFKWFRPLLEQMLAARPNLAHRALAELERAGRLHGVITQNIDGLHQRAGSREVYELHGHLRSATCIECEQQVPGDRVVSSARRGSALRCSCGAHYKPDIVLFDEMLPRGMFWLAQREIESADLVIVVGTSLEVAPASDLPLLALRRNARLMIINHGPTYLDERADIVLRADVAEALPAIAEMALLSRMV